MFIASSRNQRAGTELRVGPASRPIGEREGQRP
jgi:hypothetical protein